MLALIDEVRAITKCYRQHVDLSRVSRWKIGGLADLIVYPQNHTQVRQLIRLFGENHQNYAVIGSTSNILFSDDGVSVPIVQIGRNMKSVEFGSDHTVTAEAGIWVPELCLRLMHKNCSGLEHAVGIPGSFGGLVYMNGGSLRKNIGSSIVSVVSINQNGELIVRARDECEFGYRTSIYQNNAEIILSATMSVMQGSDKRSMRLEMLEILKSRREKFPLKAPNCGSVFKSDPVMYRSIGAPGQVIEKLGFKGFQIGGAKVSKNHANFIVNTGNATARDVLEIVRLVKNRVFQETEFSMNAEPMYLDSMGNFSPLDCVPEGQC